MKDIRPAMSTTPCACKFCQKTFRRSDILRRHYKSCPHRGQRKIPDPLRRGRRKRACDGCAKHKTSCDLDQPCENCLLSGGSCTYSRAKMEGLQTRTFDEEDRDRATLPIIEQFYPPETTKKSSRRQTDSVFDKHKTSIPFLLNWTNPNSHITDKFERSPEIIVDGTSCQDHDQALFLTGSNNNGTYDHIPLSSMQSTLSMDFAMPSPTSNLFSELFSLDEISSDLFLPIHNDDHTGLADTSVESNLCDFQLFPKGLDRDLTTEFAENLTALLASLPRDHPVYAHNLNLAVAMAILTPTNIQRFLRLYFQHWNHHSPVVHQGTFDVNSASLPLLLAITLTGALFSRFPEDVTLARTLLDLAEEFAFRDPDFLKLLSGAIPHEAHQSRIALQALQAAFSIAQLQLHEGSVYKKKYVRTVRFNQIIYAARAMSLHNTTNNFYEQQADRRQSFDWRDFGESEARIRLMYGIFNLDVALTIFYKTPPRLFFHELRVAMPCSLESYQADTNVACFQAASKERKFRPRCLAEMISGFAENRPDLYEGTGDFAPICLLSILFGLVQIIWNSKHYGYGDESMQQRLRAGLTLWKVQWDLALSELTPQQIRTVGFVKDAGTEFWYLTHYLLTAGSDTPERRTEANFSSMSKGKHLFEELLRTTQRT